MSSYDGESDANRLRSVTGKNRRGSETTRVSFYGNRYPLEKALLLFGINPEFGAQIPK